MERRVSGNIAFICGRWPLDPSRSTLVFIHGAGESSLLWHAQVEELAVRANTVALDLPGHGRSGGRAQSRVEDYARAVIDFVDAVAVPRPVPCGLSMGGAITQQLLLDEPARFPAGVIISSGARLRVLPAVFATIESDFQAYVAMIDRSGFSEKTPAAVKQAFLEDSLRADPATAQIRPVSGEEHSGRGALPCAGCRAFRADREAAGAKRRHPVVSGRQPTIEAPNTKH
ncbi:MAG: alpha/beta hydrolase [Desulfobacterales bacterium]|nr:alpha/beta hydrolase [Desulfobacterales bacterium]